MDREDSKGDSAEGFGLIGLILGLAAMGVASIDLVWPPFTDEELQVFVDSWEPAVLFGLLLLVIFGLGLLFSILFALFSRSLTRTLFRVASVAFVLATCLQVTSLNVLTARAEKASGHELHWLPRALR